MELDFVRERLEALQERSRSLEAMVEGLEGENERLRRELFLSARQRTIEVDVEEEEEDEDLAALRPKSVQEEVANVDVVK